MININLVVDYSRNYYLLHHIHFQHIEHQGDNLKAEEIDTKENSIPQRLQNQL